MQRKATERLPTLDKAEWDFNTSTLHSEQARFCMHYEYARESDSMREYVRWLQGESPEVRGRVVAHERQFAAFFGNDPERAIVFDCPEFPDTPWLKISAAFRRARVAPFLTLQTEAILPVMEYQLAMLARDPTADTVEGYEASCEPRAFAVVRLDPARSKRELEAQFARFLHGWKQPIKVRGRSDSPLDALHALAALRVLRKCGGDGTRAADFFRTLAKTPPYKNARAIERAAGRAVDIRIKLCG